MISVSGRLIFLTIVLGILVFFISPDVADTVFGGGFIAENVVGGMFVNAPPDIQNYTPWIRPFLGLFAGSKVGPIGVRVFAGAGFLFGVALLALLWGAMLSLFQLALRRLLYGPAGEMGTCSYLLRAAGINALFAASLGIYGYLRFANSFSQTMFPSESGFRFLLVPAFAFLLLCLGQHILNRKSCASVTAS